ncbi:hypothetical protein PIB30_105681 [Stylosanthes scabra]|uniref:Secreted protein n=1 Tax=Stylosanthes scabra TaxID=79078 RepID=A0ABU6VZ58_9FABA|nr:hypothetical protein [Stylosanthes scabra]
MWAVIGTSASSVATWQLWPTGGTTVPFYAWSRTESYHRRPHLFPVFFSLFCLSLTPRLFCSSTIPNSEPLRRRPKCLRQQPPSRHWPFLSLFSPLRHRSLPLAQSAPSKTVAPSTSRRRHGSSSAG